MVAGRSASGATKGEKMAKRFLILLLLVGALSAPGDLSSCGPFLPEAVFTGQLEPLDEARFFGGHLDVLQPNYRRIYLRAAYRYLAGIGLDQHDQEARSRRLAIPGSIRVRRQCWVGCTCETKWVPRLSTESIP
jgi:hypothetical protein